MTDSDHKAEGTTSEEEDIREKIMEIIIREGMIDSKNIKPESTLDDLGVQSIDVVIILNAIEDELGIYIPIDQTMNDVRTVDDLIRAVDQLSQSASSDPDSKKNQSS